MLSVWADISKSINIIWGEGEARCRKVLEFCYSLQHFWQPLFLCIAETFITCNFMFQANLKGKLYPTFLLSLSVGTLVASGPQHFFSDITYGIESLVELLSPYKECHVVKLGLQVPQFNLLSVFPCCRGKLSIDTFKTIIKTHSYKHLSKRSCQIFNIVYPTWLQRDFLSIPLQFLLFSSDHSGMKLMHLQTVSHNKALNFMVQQAQST